MKLPTLACTPSIKHMCCITFVLTGVVLWMMNQSIKQIKKDLLHVKILEHKSTDAPRQPLPPPVMYMNSRPPPYPYRPPQPPPQIIHQAPAPPPPTPQAPPPQPQPEPEPQPKAAPEPRRSRGRAKAAKIEEIDIDSLV